MGAPKRSAVTQLGLDRCHNRISLPLVGTTARYQQPGVIG